MTTLQVFRGYSAVSPTTDELQGYTAAAVDEMTVIYAARLHDEAHG